MSKKDYQALARAIHEAYEAADGGKNLEPETAAAKAAVYFVQKRIADILAADNPRFDRGRFVEACETGKTKGMPR